MVQFSADHDWVLSQLKAAHTDLQRLISEARAVGVSWSIFANTLGVGKQATIELYVGSADPNDPWTKEDLESHIAALMTDD